MHLDDFRKQVTDRDKPLRFDWKIIDQDKLMSKLHDKFDFSIKNRKLRIDALCSLAVAGVRNSIQGRYTSYSRDNNWYTGRNEFFGCPHFTRAHIVGAFRDTENSGMFENIIAPKGTFKNKDDLYRPQSKFKATPDLIDVVRDVPRTYKQRQPIIVKDEFDFLTYIPDTDFSLRRRKEIDELNEFYRNSLEVGFESTHKRYGNMYQIGDDWVETRTFQVFSSFCQSSWDKGGRIYHWVSNMKKETRAKLLINDETTVELDYKMMQPTMLFADIGIQLDRDVYDLGQFYELGDSSRDLHKRAFAAALNGSSVHRAAHGMMEKAPPEWKLTLKQANETVQRFIDNTPEIKHLMFKGQGLTLQRRDSDIIVSVLKVLIRDGIPAISIHDSVIVPERNKDHVRDVMLEAYSRHYPTYKIEVR